MSENEQPSVRSPLQGFCGYSSEELSETTRLTSKEDPRWRLVLLVTRGTRDFIIDQMPALIATYGVAVALILAAASIERSVPFSVVALWLVESVVSIAARTLIFRHMVRASPVKVASSAWLRLLPMVAIVLAAVHWSWTATIFIGPHLNLMTVVMLLTYVMLSIACLGIAPASPAICTAYLVPMWGATAWMLAASDWASGSTLLALRHLTHVSRDGMRQVTVGFFARCSQRPRNLPPGIDGRRAGSHRACTALRRRPARAQPTIFLGLDAPQRVEVAGAPARRLPRRLGLDTVAAQLLGEGLPPAVQVGLARVQALAVLRLGPYADVHMRIGLVVV